LTAKILQEFDERALIIVVENRRIVVLTELHNYLVERVSRKDPDSLGAVYARRVSAILIFTCTKSYVSTSTLFSTQTQVRFRFYTYRYQKELATPYEHPVWYAQIRPGT
jgi:hypothetical protein